MKECWWCAAILAVLLYASREAVAQSVVDNKNCEQYSIHCPKDGEPSYKKYCCVESNGGVVLYSCCNPYLGLIIGVSVGIPTVILVIVGVIVAYCVCHYHHNRRMQTLVATYRQRRREEDRRREARYLAPPPYSDLSEEVVGLPAYTETDPYKSVTNDLSEDRGSSNEEVVPGNGEGGSLTTEQSTSGDRVPLLDEVGEG